MADLRSSPRVRALDEPPDITALLVSTAVESMLRKVVRNEAVGMEGSVLDQLSG